MSLSKNQTEFLGRLKNLPAEKRMYLRKAIGTTLKPGSKSWQAFLSLDPPFYNEEEKQAMFFVACVGALSDSKSRTSIKDMLKKAIDRGERFEEKFLSLTKDRADKNGNFETKMYRFFGKEILENANLEELLDGILHWNHPKKYVQEKWCLSIYNL